MTTQTQVRSTEEALSVEDTLKQVLEALYPISHNTTDDPRGQADKAITAVKEALAQPEQEPVADIDGDEFDAHFRKRINVYADEHPALLVRQLARRLRKEWSTAPTQQKPLTDEQIYLITGVENRDEMMQRMARNIARAIEAAHGIKENT